ncbi:D-glycerate dehydrogenase [Maritimibacter sp. DP1N21-5]|uniref:2-hydroxyacid dehydrogenase n=1 Tax=Maritimibacter sp. DP1N21-5 TaxID=2836867 RepID=UPI001C49666B|nr:D-glycerate dehydrogenase [Maritimibacter sp. DP1N21-5]MBV7408433.1 D-glycerate dehydrogenase [Maritimibacter sp. DP1N21-5]
MALVLVARPLPDTVIDALAVAHDVDFRDATWPMDVDEMLAALRDYDAVLCSLGDRFSAELFTKAGKPRCRLIANFGVGYNHIDVAAARRAGVAVTNTPGAVTDATADIALTLMLMACRRAGEGERLVRSGTWEGWHPMQMLGLHMTGKTLGIIGMGRIGQAIARRAHHGFGMNILFHNRSPKKCEVPAKQMERIEDVAAWADVLVIAVPGGPETTHLVGRKVFAAMPEHAVFVNISRGEVVDEAALIEALEAHSIGAAGLDVYEYEPDVPERLRACENAVLLPHLGTATLEVRTEMGMMAARNILSFLKDGTLENPV